MQGLFSTAATIAAAVALAAPAAVSAVPFGSRQYTDVCTETSMSPDFAWTVSNFKYRGSWLFSTPAHQIASGTVDFNLTNPAFGSDQHFICSATSGQLQDFFYGTMSYNCTLPGTDYEPSGATFTYSTPATELVIEDVWRCDGHSLQFNATSTTTLDLECTEDNYTNPDWQEGETYSSRTVECGPATTSVSFDTMDISRY